MPLKDAFIIKEGTPFDDRSAQMGQQPGRPAPNAGGQASPEQAKMQWAGLLDSGQVVAHGPGEKGGDHIFFITAVDGRYMLSIDPEGEIKIEKQD